MLWWSCGGVQCAPPCRTTRTTTASSAFPRMPPKLGFHLSARPPSPVAQNAHTSRYAVVLLDSLRFGYLMNECRPYARHRPRSSEGASSGAPVSSSSSYVLINTNAIGAGASEATLRGGRGLSTSFSSQSSSAHSAAMLSQSVPSHVSGVAFAAAPHRGLDHHRGGSASGGDVRSPPSPLHSPQHQHRARHRHRHAHAPGDACPDPMLADLVMVYDTDQEGMALDADGELEDPEARILFVEPLLSVEKKVLSSIPVVVVLRESFPLVIECGMFFLADLFGW